MTRRHGIECAQVGTFLRSAFPEWTEDMDRVEEDTIGSITIVDWILNKIRTDKENPLHHAKAAEAIGLILIKCRKLEQQIDGHWKPTNEMEEQEARWDGVPSMNAAEVIPDAFNNITITEVQNPCQTAERAALAIERNRMVGRGNACRIRDYEIPDIAEGIG